ncbi:MAG TPA: hypothetical protein VNZ56_02745 [Verrucomicrobiae bacterium]|jgi:hypothetical protein|nr:hypothetical protein [Verrucomicrobiae bacterium]
MRIPVFSILSLLATILLGSSANAPAQTPETVAGRVLSIHCDAYLTRSGLKGDYPLLSPRDIGLGLAAEDNVRCKGMGYLEILVATGQTKITSSLKDGYKIRPLPSSPEFPAENTNIVDALKNYGIVGATRGNAAQSRILWPVDGSAVLPENFVVRWGPVSQKIAVSVLTEAKDVTVWGPTDVDGSAGVLKSAGASSALAAYKKKAPNARLVLTITFGNENDWEEARFSFLSAQQEQDLNAQLDFWAKNTAGLTLHLGRGYAYTRHKLFAEAADEYETALESAPESPYLLKDAIEAEQRAGRASRVKELQSRLTSLPPAVNP